MRYSLGIAMSAVFAAGCAAVNQPLEPPVVRAPADLGPNPCEGISPVVAVPPQYPREALMAGAGGSVEVSFDVAADGSTTNHAVVTATAGRTFNAAAIEAVSKWRFPASDSDCRGATYTITFGVDNGSTWPPKIF